MLQERVEQLLDELYNLTLKAEEEELTDAETDRYIEIVEELQLNNIEIPFGINM